MEKSYADTASYRLYHGKIHTFFDAVCAMLQQYRDEKRWIRTKYQHFDPDGAAEGLLEMEGYIAQAERCRQAYTDALHQMEQTLVQQWSTSPDEITQMLAAALKTGNYRPLAL